MSCLIFKMIFSSMEAGGGVPGKDAGTVHIIMIEDGCIIEECRPFTDMYLPGGETITETGNGRDIPGNISGSLLRNSSATGGDGKETNTGKDITPGAFRDCLPNIRSTLGMNGKEAICNPHPVLLPDMGTAHGKSSY